MRKYRILVYGSYGYTGNLIVELLRKTDQLVLLSGRDEKKLKDQSLSSGFPFQPCEIGAPGTPEFQSLVTLLSQVQVVIHCAGPFSSTARSMAEACMKSGTHYLDITGEYGVFRELAGLDGRAKESGILLMPGVGFDVVPTDCMARHLKDLMPEASELVLAFASVPAGVSRGTARTVLQHAGEPTKIRRGGKICQTDQSPPEMEIDFGPFKKHAVGISWGDIETAYHTTGIPDISVFLGVSDRQRLRMRKLFKWGWLLKWGLLRRVAGVFLGKSGSGPSDKVLKEGKTYIYGKVTGRNGESIERWLKTPNGYALTATAAVHIAMRVLTSDITTGYHTPAGMFGAGLVRNLPGVGEYSSIPIAQ